MIQVLNIFIIIINLFIIIGLLYFVSRRYDAVDYEIRKVLRKIKRLFWSDRANRSASYLLKKDHQNKIDTKENEKAVNVEKALKKAPVGKGSVPPPAYILKEWGEGVSNFSNQDVVTFGICLASARTVPDWKTTSDLLSGTLQSLINQTNPNFRIIICGHEIPEIAEINDERVAFLSLDAPPPSGPSAFRSDKSKKRFNIGRMLREVGGGYYMQLDADDRVSAHLVELVLSRRGHGFILPEGYAMDWANRLIAPVPGAWPFGLNKVCGSTSVIFYNNEDLPGEGDGLKNTTLLWNMTRQHEHVDVALFEVGRPLDKMDEPAVAYLVNHQQNLSFQMQKADTRGQNVIASIQREAITDLQKLREIEKVFALEEGAFSNAQASYHEPDSRVGAA